MLPNCLLQLLHAPVGSPGSVEWTRTVARIYVPTGRKAAGTSGWNRTTGPAVIGARTSGCGMRTSPAGTHSLAHICVWMIITIGLRIQSAIPRTGPQPKPSWANGERIHFCTVCLFVCLFARFLPANPSSMTLSHWWSKSHHMVGGMNSSLRYVCTHVYSMWELVDQTRWVWMGRETDEERQVKRDR